MSGDGQKPEPLADLIARWRKEAADWQAIADDARARRNYPMSHRLEGRAEVYKNCAVALEQWQAEQPAQPPREINCTAATTQVRPNYDQGTRTQRPIAFGFGSSR